MPPNMQRIITGHNVSILKQKNTPVEPLKTCNCRKNADPCPMEGKCLQESIVYQATVTETKTNKNHTYIGLTADPFKTRYGNHKKSFTHEKYSHDTELSNFLWDLKKEKIENKVKWKVIDKAKTFSPVSNICHLCTREKYYLIFKPDICTLNQKNELGSHCRHKKGLLHCSL